MKTVTSNTAASIKNNSLVPEIAEHDEEVRDQQNIQKHLIKAVDDYGKSIPETVQRIKSLKEKVKSVSEDFEIGDKDIDEAVDAENELAKQEESLKEQLRDNENKKGGLVKLQVKINEVLRAARLKRIGVLQSNLSKFRKENKKLFDEFFSALDKIVEAELELSDDQVKAELRMNGYPEEAILRDRFPHCKAVVEQVANDFDRVGVQKSLNELVGSKPFMFESDYTAPKIENEKVDYDEQGKGNLHFGSKHAIK